MEFVFILAGLAALVAGSELLVRSSVMIARKANVSALLIGLTLVGLGTSTPELAASVGAALLGLPAIAVGNVVGSNIANILLIVGISAILFPLTVQPFVFKRDAMVMAAATLILWLITLYGVVELWMGGLLLFGLGLYLWTACRSEKKAAERPVETAGLFLPAGPQNLLLIIAGFIAGVALLAFGADWLIDGAAALARTYGVSDSIIGLTVVAVGTSLPELATSVNAALRKETDLAVGNIIGSNIFNILGILGVTALVTPLSIPRDIASIDIYILLAATILLLLFARTGGRITRKEGIALLAGYGLYLTLRLAYPV